MKLSDFKDEKGVEVIGKLLSPMCKIAANPENAKAKSKGVAGFASAMLRNSPKEVMEMLAILDDKDPGEYHCNGATVLMDVFNMLNDEVLLQLFGLQGRRAAAASSGSASENTEGRKK